jgi:fucose permease
MIMSPIVSAVCANRRAIALNRLHAFYCLGAVGTVLAASASMHLGVSWRLVSASMAVVPLALLVAFAVVPLPPLVHPDFTRDGLRHLMRRPRFLLALAAIALIGATEAGMSQWLPAYSERELGYDRASSGAVLVAFSVAMALGRMLASHRTNRLNPHVILFVPAVICFGCYLSSTLSTMPLLALASSILLGFACGPLWPTKLALTADRFPHGGASMFALLAGSGNFGCLVMPWIIGMVAEGTSLRTGLLAGSLAPLALLVILATVWSIDRSKQAAG